MSKPKSIAVLAALIFTSGVAGAEVRNGSCTAFLEAHARSFDGSTSGYPKLFGFHGDTGIPTWMTGDTGESWLGTGSTHEIQLPIDAPGVRPLGEVKVITDSQKRIVHIQEMSFVKATLVIGTQIDLDYSSDGFCLPRKMFNFLINNQKFEVTKVLFELDKCQGANSSPDCRNPEIFQALSHRDTPAVFERAGK